ncbi:MULTISPECIES: hypothetical protein [Natrinema]|nr:MULTISPECIES: hypothetical protein [Natrinema]AFO59157.1 hypothetical protein NJ7G_3943 [Natrinema sp. J7-2]
MTDGQPSMSRRKALQATAGAAAATVAMTGTAAAERASPADVSVGDCLRLPSRVTVYESCTSDSGFIVPASTAGTIEALCLDEGRVLVDWRDPSLKDGYVDVREVISGIEPC